ncbi:unnamed protein product [Mytilus coruscus]|uniref:DNA/RNA non-specific endonuclease domain-containing protein n=1 Tax=Mytilus coruscus TaxID=42192 RepID=A0A6J8F528_MYTCO|nr:unnamed protein product [Mytilus coruscus]
MHSTTKYFYFYIVIFFKYILVDVVCVTHTTYRQANTNYAQSLQNITTETKVNKRTLNNLSILFANFIKDIRKAQLTQRPIFYKGLQPTLRGNPVHYKYLDLKFYATLYDTENKIPAYCAYTLHFDHRRISGRINGWYLNFLLNVNEQPKIEDYIGIGKLGFHRGHLYPQFYAAETQVMRRMTNLITNIAIQHGTFNINTWKRLEFGLFRETRYECNSAGGESFFLTGVIPSRRNFFNKINIPKYFWTAVCCDISDAHELGRLNWSFAYIVANDAKRTQNIDMYSVKDFRDIWLPQFGSLFTSPGEVECSSDPEKSINVITKIINKNNKDRFFIRGELLRFSNRSRERSRTVGLMP